MIDLKSQKNISNLATIPRSMMLEWDDALYLHIMPQNKATDSTV